MTLIRIYIPRGLDLDTLIEANPHLKVHRNAANQFFDVSRRPGHQPKERYCVRCRVKVVLNRAAAIAAGWNIKSRGIDVCPKCMGRS
jgi:hypothetical protein